MNQITHVLRLANWKTIIDSCQMRPGNQTAREWLAENNNICEKQFGKTSVRLVKAVANAL